jgi:spermidine synthase
MAVWFEELLYEDFSAAYRVDRTIFRDRSEHQDLLIFQHERFGRVLTLDSIVQLTEADEFIYHEMMSHVPILAHGNARHILIIGGGDGGVLRRCLMHKSVEQVTKIEIDQSVIDLCLEYLPSISAGAFDDPRSEVIIADGAKFVAESERKFDVIIVDSTDPIGPGKVLFEPEFYRNCVRLLNEGGVMVTQSGVPLWEPISSELTHAGLKPAIKDFGFYRAAIPTYAGGDMLLGWGSNDPAKRQTPIETLRERFKASGIKTKFYTPEVHHGAFAIPPVYLEHLA